MGQINALEMERTRLRLTCRHLAGGGPTQLADEFDAIAAWLRENGDQGSGGNLVPGVQPEVYGKGALVEDFETEVSTLFGMPAARFMPSRCMAQPIALRIWSERARNATTAFHPTSHLQLHEELGYRELHGLSAQLIGDASRPTTAADVAMAIGPGGVAKKRVFGSLTI